MDRTRPRNLYYDMLPKSSTLSKPAKTKGSPLDKQTTSSPTMDPLTPELKPLFDFKSLFATEGAASLQPEEPVKVPQQPVSRLVDSPLMAALSAQKPVPKRQPFLLPPQSTPASSTLEKQTLPATEDEPLPQVAELDESNLSESEEEK